MSPAAFCTPECQAYQPKTQFWSRLSDVPWGLGLVFRTPSLRRLVWLPLCLTVLGLGLALGLGLHWFQTYLSQWIDLILPVGTTAYGLRTFFSVFSYFSALLLFMVLFLPLSSLLTMPFMDPLSAQTEALLLKESPSPPLNPALIFKGMLWLSLFKFLFLLLALALLALPLVGPFCFSFLLSLMVSLDFLDLIWMRKGYCFREKRAFLKANWGGWWLYNLALMPMLWIPLLQLLLVPAASAGAVRFYLAARKSI